MDFSLTVWLQIIQILVVAGGGLGVAIRFGQVTGVMQHELREMKESTKKIGDILTQVALQKQAIDYIQKRVDQLERKRSRKADDGSEH